MNKLKSKNCVPCRGDDPPLEPQEIKEQLKKLESGWEADSDPDKLIKEYEFKDFVSAMEFVNKIADIAEQEGHHPNIYIHSYNKVKIELWTHKINGLHQNDFIMAAKIEGLS